MGYINNIGNLSGTTCIKELSISWTKIGREYLIGKRVGRKNGLTIKYFSLQDEDVNYNTNLNNKNSFVPNITGIDNQCINGNSVDQVKSLVNYNKKGQILIKNYNILLTDNQNNASCPTNQLIYDAFIDGVSIFKQNPNYYGLYFSYINNGIFFDYGQFFKQTYIKDSLSSIINVSFSSMPIGNGNSLKINSYSININNSPNNTIVTDNSNTICSNKFSGLITFNQQVVIDQNQINTINMSTYNIPNC